MRKRHVNGFWEEICGLRCFIVAAVAGFIGVIRWVIWVDFSVGVGVRYFVFLEGNICNCTDLPET